MGAAPPIADEPARPSWAVDFIATTPDVELFPRRAWIRAAERALRDAPNEALDYGDHRGRIELRRALSAYLGRVRGVRIEPERMVISQGFTQGLDLVRGCSWRAAAMDDRVRVAVAAGRLGHPGGGGAARGRCRSMATVCGRTRWTRSARPPSS